MLLTLVSMAVVAADPTPAQPKQAVTGVMQANLALVVTLQPLIATQSVFRDDANAKQIRAALEGLAKINHGLGSDPKAANAPIAALFNEELTAAKDEFASGHRDAARDRLKGITSMCLACHSRTLVEKDFADPGKLVDSLKLGPVERAEYYAATRQFDRAKETWEKVLAAPPASDSDAFDQARALRLAVVTLVRAKAEPAALVKLLEPQAARADYPNFVRASIKQWLADTKAWQAEKFDAAKQSPAKLVAKAKALLQATKLDSLPQPDEARLVSNMRAAAYAQEALELDPAGKERGQALFLLGLATSALADPELWQLDALYLEMCVRENPHSELARACVARLSERLYYGFNGSRGGPLPAGYVTRLGELKTLAK